MMRCSEIPVVAVRTVTTEVEKGFMVHELFGFVFGAVLKNDGRRRKNIQHKLF